MSTQLVLFVHGSQSPSAQSYYQTLLDRMRAKFGTERVRLAHLQFLEPDIRTQIRTSVSGGIENFAILPVFLAPGNHIEIDLPKELSALCQEFPEINIEVLKPIGEDERFLQLVEVVAGKYLI